MTHRYRTLPYLVISAQQSWTSLFTDLTEAVFWAENFKEPVGVRLDPQSNW